MTTLQCKRKEQTSRVDLLDSDVWLTGGLQGVTRTKDTARVCTRHHNP